MHTYIGRAERDHVDSGLGPEQGRVVGQQLADGAAEGVACVGVRKEGGNEMTGVGR